ncbi:caltractin [Trypanosoma grayi]|uniref:caltractin n=1 Tax=Trypanosoma grayi TaxID=71804 RepID=UPI0004F4AC41|nr:caltractin [Trypanosoma grayi]KEG10251.1 caltractin [Trypanosoma grayi]
MTALDALKEDILDVFQVFDEDGSGSISMQELTRALHTITGIRLSRVDLRLLIQAAQEDLAEEASAKKVQDGGEVLTEKPVDGAKAQEASTEQDAVDSTLFVAVVLKTLNRRTYEQELLFTFHLLEDKNYPGFITKESLKNAAAEMEERLTDQEVDEMFDTLVTGVPTAAVDLATFTSVLEAARKSDY